MSLDPASLAQFTGTENWFRHRLANVLYTDGAKHVADNAGAHWLLDEIALAQRGKVAAEEFQVWTLKKTGSRATLVCDDGNGNVVMTKAIAFTDFPLDSITLWCVRGDKPTIICSRASIEAWWAAQGSNL